MRYSKECYLWFLLIIKLSIPLTGCQPMTSDNNVKKNEVASYPVAYLNFNISDALTLEQLSDIFPKQLGGLEKTNIKLDQTTGTATAFYGRNKYEISITDDLRNNLSNIYLFKRKYRQITNNAVGEKIIKTVRDGYKTITTLENSETTSISFVFKQRYIIKITGTNHQTPYMVWRFLELNKLHSLHE